MLRVGLTAILALLAAAIVAATADARPDGAREGGERSLGGLLAPRAACPGQDRGGAPARAQEKTMRCMIAYARARRGRAALDDSPKLDRSASAKASDIVRCDEFSHSACGREFTYWFIRFGYASPGDRCWRAGENIAWGTGSLGTVRSIMDAWLHSPGHLANILDRDYRAFGVGLEVGALDGYRGAHVWVTHFGAQC